MRKLLLIIGILFITTGVIVVNGLLTAKDQSVNQLSVGNNTIEIVETFEPPENIFPGQEVTKNVAVKNTDNCACYVRVYPVFSDESLLSYIEIDYQSEWLFCEEDGYFYYPDVLKSGQTTSPLFTKVTINQSLSEEEAKKMKELVISIYGESCQKGNAKDYSQAWEKMRANYEKG